MIRRAKNCKHHIGAKLFFQLAQPATGTHSSSNSRGRRGDFNHFFELLAGKRLQIPHHRRGNREHPFMRVRPLQRLPNKRRRNLNAAAAHAGGCVDKDLH